MAGGDGSWRAHEYSGALVREGGGNAINSQLRPPPYLTASFPNIFSVWDYVPHVSYLCRTRGGLPDVGCDQDGEDRVDLSPRDHQITTCTKEGISETIKRLT